uniref:Uncharacterized protein n=1 Tax=Arion vulgaris TaxID=1028688 RepID=A0A0B6YNQ8_9EUPU
MEEKDEDATQFQKQKWEARSSPTHCYIIPITNKQGSSPGASSTTYRESFRSPSGNQGFSRRVASAPSSPISAAPMLPSLLTRSTYTSSTSRQSPMQSDASTLLSSLPSRHNSRDSSFGRSNTTYRDHFTWLS